MSDLLLGGSTMFGFIRPVKDELRVREVRRFQEVYCGLCHAIRARYGRFHTFFLSYDMTFFALMLGCTESDGCTERRRCDASPLRAKQVCCGSAAIDWAADISVLLNYHKLRDTARDETGPKRLGAKLLLRLAAPGYRRAADRCPDADREIASCINDLAVLEAERCDSIDRAADPTARLLAAAVPPTGGARERILRQLFYHTGRWVYLIDACEDLAKDLAQGSYNPVALRFQLSTPDLSPVREQLERTLERSLADICTAFDLLGAQRDAGLIENIIWLGLPTVTRQVLDGTYQMNGGQMRHGPL